MQQAQSVYVVTVVSKEIEFEQANYLRTELSSLGIECKRRNQLNGRDELDTLATAIKEVHFQDCKTAYHHDKDSHIEIDKAHFDRLIWIDTC